MPHERAIILEGRVVQVLGKALFLVELRNGHRVVAHLAGRCRERAADVVLGGVVTLEMSPFDMSTGRVMLGG